MTDHSACQLPSNGGCQHGRKSCPIARDPKWPYETDGWIEASDMVEKEVFARVGPVMPMMEDFRAGVEMATQVAIEAYRIAAENRADGA